MYILPIFLFLVLVAADQIIKYLAVSKLMPLGNINIIDNFFSLTYVENRGAAFGLMEGAKWLFIILTVAVCIGCVIYYVKIADRRKSFCTKAAIVLICAGAVGNMLDRVFRGFVVDMLDFIIFGYDFPVFNFADICVCTGAALLLAGAFLFDREEN